MDLIKPKTLASIAALLLLGIVLLIVSKKSVLNTKTLAYGSIAIALSFVLATLKIFQMPYGGTITVASMLPLFVFAYIAGPRAGMLAGLCYGLIHYFQEPYFLHWAQFLLDYPLPSAMLGLAGVFRKNLFAGAVVGGAARFVCHFIAGVVFYASYAGDQNVFVYSAIYNGSYVLPDLIICLLIMLVPNVRTAIKRVIGMSVEKMA